MHKNRWMVVVFFIFKQKTAYEMRISDWSSDVCSSDLEHVGSEIEERVLDLRKRFAGVGRKDHRGLPHVVEKQRRHDEIQPRHADRLSAEVPQDRQSVV